MIAKQKHTELKKRLLTSTATLIILMIVSVVTASAQEMGEGFKDLEAGRFSEAKSFFTLILKEYPENKTARICYGRAAGLSGNKEEAVEIFLTLEKEYPGDKEVLLNLAESHLWKSDGLQALEIFNRILEKDSLLFGALLGKANSYSVIKDYDNAYQAIQKALSVDPSNGQALISQKYIILGLANHMAGKENKTDEALQLLEINLKNNSADQETIYLKASILRNIKKFQPALKVFGQLTDSIKRLLESSTTLHLMKKEAEALKYAIEAKEMATQLGDSVKERQAALHYINALLWNDQQENADGYLLQLEEKYAGEPFLLIAKARAAIFSGDYISGADFYQKYLETEPASFEGNLGTADAYHALGMDMTAYNGSFKTLEYYQGQKDAVNFVDKLNKEHSPSLNGKLLLEWASDGSSNISNTIGGTLDLSPVSQIFISRKHKSYQSSDSSKSSDSELMTIGLSHQTNNRLKLSAAASLFKAQSNGENQSFNFDDQTMNINAKILVSKNQKLTIGYQSEFQDFNHDLLARQLKTHHIFGKNSFFWKNLGLGNYTELYRSYFSDSNNRSLLFTSFYKNFGKKKNFKSGANYLFIAFKEAKPTDYYSPLLYNQVEAFFDYSYKIKAVKDLKITLESAVGHQWSDNTKALTGRAKLSVTGKFGWGEYKVFGQYATATASAYQGFTYQAAGAELIIRLSNKPIFYKKIKKSYQKNK